MTKLIATAAIVCAGAAVLLAQTGPAKRSQTLAPPKPAAITSVAAQTSAGDAKTYRALVDKYCVGCHNSRNAQPASDPLNLEKASLDDVIAGAAAWERVLHKLSVRAMPPQNM